MQKTLTSVDTSIFDMGLNVTERPLVLIILYVTMTSPSILP